MGQPDTVRVAVDPGEVRDLRADDRGRITLGKDYANQRVRVAVERIENSEENT